MIHSKSAPIRIHRSSTRSLLAFVAATAIATNANAQAPDQKAAAQSLFDRAKELMAAGKYDEACKRLEESQRLDAGMGTQFRLAECYEKAGRLASAWSIYLEVVSEAEIAKQTERQNLARLRASSLQPKLSSLTLVVPPDVAAISGLEIKRDGVAVGSGQWGAPLPADAGAHDITASAPGMQTWSNRVDVRANAGSAVVEVPLLSAAAAPSSETVPRSAAISPATGDTGNPTSGAMSPRKTIGFVVGGLGIVGIAVGAGLGVMAFSKKGDSNADGHCHGDLCDSTGLGLRSDSLSAGTASTIAFILGGALAGAGAVLIATAPKTSGVDAKVAVGLGRLQVRVAW